MWATSAAALLDHAGACSPAETALHTMGLDADLENAMQWLNAEIGPVEDVDKVGTSHHATWKPAMQYDHTSGM